MHWLGIVASLIIADRGWVAFAEHIFGTDNLELQIFVDF
jgi:hypothetical protein